MLERALCPLLFHYTREGRGNSHGSPTHACALGGEKPQTGGSLPRCRRQLVAVALAVSGAALAGCGSSPDTKSTARGAARHDPLAGRPFYSDGELTLYQSKMPVTLPLIKPTDEQLPALRATKVAPYTRTPWFTKERRERSALVDRLQPGRRAAQRRAARRSVERVRPLLAGHQPDQRQRNAPRSLRASTWFSASTASRA